MANAEEQLKTLSDKLDVQLNTLYFEREETHNILSNMNINEVKDQLDLYKNSLQECKQTQREIRKFKL